MKVPAWAWTIGWMMALTAHVWTWLWVRLAMFLIWKARWSDRAAKRDLRYVFEAQQIAAKAAIAVIVPTYRVIGRFGINWALFIAKRAKDFDWVDQLDG